MLPANAASGTRCERRLTLQTAAGMTGAEQYAPPDGQNALAAGNEFEARSRSAGIQSSQRDHDGRAFSNVESPPEDFFARDSALSAPPVSGSGSIVESGNDVTQGRAHSFDRSLPPPHPEAYASDDGRPVSPIPQSQSPAHSSMHSPSEFGGSPRHFGDAVEFETSPVQSAGSQIGAMSSIHSASPKSAARRSLQQDFSEAESPVRSDRQLNPSSLGGSRNGVASTLSFTTAGGSRSGNGSDPVLHGGSGLMDSHASMHTVHAFSDESSSGHEFDDDLRESANGLRRSVSSARSLGRDGGRPQRSPSSEIATQTDPPEVQVSGTYTSPAAAQQMPPTEMQQQGGLGVHRVGGGGHLWMVDSDHREETAQVCKLSSVAAHVPNG